MKKLFLFALFAALCCSCTESGTDENPDPNGGSNSGQTTPPDPDPAPDPDPDAKDVIHVPEGGMLAGILNELGLTEPSSLKLSGTLDMSDFVTLRTILSLKNLDISRVNLTVLPTNAFYKCANIKSLVLPNTLTAIDKNAFLQSSLSSITIPNSVKTIGETAFYGCPFNSIEIPASVETIEWGAFADCTSLQTVTFEKGSKLKTISNGAFAFCWALTTVDMSACTQVTVIGEYAFYEDSKLQLFKIGTRTPPSCGDDVFSRYINSSSVLKVPAGCVDAYKKAKGWKGFTTISELDE